MSTAAAPRPSLAEMIDPKRTALVIIDVQRDFGAPDGLYGIRFTATDDCGNELVMDRFVVVDATAPEIALDRPEEGEQLRDVIPSRRRHALLGIVDILDQHAQVIGGMDVRQRRWLIDGGQQGDHHLFEPCQPGVYLLGGAAACPGRSCQ